MKYYEYIEEREALARKRFADHKAKVVLRDENFFVLDWRHESGTIDYFVRYVLDIKRGCFIISGDLGNCIACWYNPVSPENLAGYVKGIAYFMGKFQCSSNKYTYNYEDIKEDFQAIKDELLGDGWGGYTEEEIDEDIEDLERLFDDFDPSGHCYPRAVTDIFEKYNPDWWESDFVDIGQRIDQRVVLWSIGYQMAMKQLEETR